MKPMYLDYFGMAEAPFSIAPDPRYLFMSPRHREALAHLLYGVRSDDGFVVLTGEVGAGKTTVCRCLLEQLPADCEVALIFNPRLSVLELLATVCEEFRIAVPAVDPGVKAYIDRINAWLLDIHAQGRMAVLIIDEAQSLDVQVLEQVRLLTNLETNRRKLLRIVLLGQPQLRDILARPDMTQLAQRVVARFHLGPLSRPDTAAYVAHRLAVAGGRPELFSPAALARLYRLSGGIPRLINIIADRALLGAYVQGRPQVEGAIVLQAGREVLGEGRPGRRRSPARSLSVGIGALCGAAAVLAAYVYYDASADAPARASVTAPLRPVVPEIAAPAPPAIPVKAAAATMRAPAAKEPAGAPRTFDLLRQGSRGAAVESLRRELTRLRGTPLDESPSPLFDAELAEEVRRFQAAEGLPVDGMVGPRTRQRLGSLIAAGAQGAGEPGKEP